MKLLFDARYIRPDYIDGISRYTIELARALCDLHSQLSIEFLICDPKQKDLLPDKPCHLVNSPLSLRELWMGYRLNHLSPDVVFCPMQTMGSFGKKYKLILTLHDLIYYEHKTPPHFLPLYARVTWWLFHSIGYWPQRLLLNRADTVATVSHTTASLIKAHRLSKKPAVVISNAPHTFRAHSPRPHTTKNLLYMGSSMPYKNIETLIESLRELPEYTLHILSRVSPARQKELLAHAPKQAQIVFHGGVSDEQYHQLLMSAHALVTASKSEGFGLPVIEAMQAGAPVICSDIPIFKEITDGAALYFPPDDAATFATQVRALEDTKQRTHYIEKGQRRANAYSWAQSAEQLVSVATGLADHAPHSPPSPL